MERKISWISLPAAFLLGYLGDSPLLRRAPGKLAFDFRSRGGGSLGEGKGKGKRKVVRGVLLRLLGGVWMLSGGEQLGL